MAGPNFDRERVARLGEALPLLFYGLIFIAFLCALTGSPGSGLLILILAGCAHVARVGIEGRLEQDGTRLPGEERYLASARGLVDRHRAKLPKPKAKAQSAPPRRRHIAAEAPSPLRSGAPDSLRSAAPDSLRSAARDSLRSGAPDPLRSAARDPLRSVRR